MRDIERRQEAEREREERKAAKEAEAHAAERSRAAQVPLVNFRAKGCPKTA